MRQTLMEMTAAEVSLQIIVVDNGSSDESAALVREEFPEVTLIANPDNQYHHMTL